VQLELQCEFVGAKALSFVLKLYPFATVEQTFFSFLNHHVIVINGFLNNFY